MWLPGRMQHTHPRVRRDHLLQWPLGLCLGTRSPYLSVDTCWVSVSKCLLKWPSRGSSLVSRQNSSWSCLPPFRLCLGPQAVWASLGLEPVALHGARRGQSLAHCSHFCYHPLSQWMCSPHFTKRETEAPSIWPQSGSHSEQRSNKSGTWGGTNPAREPFVTSFFSFFPFSFLGDVRHSLFPGGTLGMGGPSGGVCVAWAWGSLLAPSNLTLVFRDSLCLQ